MRICVIGAGPSGLTTVKQLLDEGHDVTCYEREDDIGGIWYRHEGDDDQMKVYDHMHLTISMKLMAYSDFMAEERVFATREGYHRYLLAYAQKYDLRRYIRCGHEVKQVRKTADGGWRVSVTARDGGAREEAFEAVAICSGPFRAPKLDTVPHLDRFTGPVLHSSRYRDNREFRDKRVLVVGLAESGADIVRQISNVSSRCTLSIKSRPFLLPRIIAGRWATDQGTSRVHHHEMYRRATKVPYPMRGIFGDDALSRAVFFVSAATYGLAELVAASIDSWLGRTPSAPLPESPTNIMGQAMYPLKLDIDTEYTAEHVDLINQWNDKAHRGASTWSQKAIFCKNVSFIPQIANGKIRVNDAGIEDIEGRKVRFADGTVEEFDAIVLCTGFTEDFSVLGDGAVKDNNVRNLYKHSIDPNYGGRLAWIGFVRPFSGAIPICAEMQARYFALLCSGKISLPPNVHDLIEREKAWEETWTEYSPRHFEAIPSQIFFMDSIAKEIGALMSLRELVMAPKLLVRHWYYPFNQSCYRLKGPHAMPEEARAQMMSERAHRSQALACATLALLPHFIHPWFARLDYPEAKPAARSPERATSARPAWSEIATAIAKRVLPSAGPSSRDDARPRTNGGAHDLASSAP